MPGPGQGKRSNKKKWCENTHSANIAAVDAVMMALSITTTNTRTTPAPSTSNDGITAALLADEMAPYSCSHTTMQSTTAITTTDTTEEPAANDATNATRVDTATAVSPANDVSSQPQPFTYTHEEVQELLEEAQLEGWREGMEEGYKMGKKKGVEEMEEQCKKDW
jgi:hypothetical protein